MKDLFGNIAEQKIREAIARGEDKNLPGSGKPVKLENLYFLPPEFKFAYTVLKNSGYLKLDDDEKVPVSLTSNVKNSLIPSNPTRSIRVNISFSIVSDEIIASNVKFSNPTKNNQDKALNYNIIRDSRRGRF